MDTLSSSTLKFLERKVLLVFTQWLKSSHFLNLIMTSLGGGHKGVRVGGWGENSAGLNHNNRIENYCVFQGYWKTFL